jgi:hypothetical protein
MKSKTIIGLILIGLQFISYWGGTSPFPELDHHGDSGMAWAAFIGKLIGSNFLLIIGAILILKTALRKTDLENGGSESIKPQGNILSIEEPEIKLVSPQNHLLDEPNNQIKEEAIEETPILFTTLSIKKVLTTSQKIILSLSSFGILAIISYVIAEKIDYRVKITETWFVWVLFIIIESWLQSKLWNDELQMKVKLPQPKWNQIKHSLQKNKRTSFIGIVILIIGTFYLTVHQINKYLEDREIERLSNGLKLRIKERGEFTSKAILTMSYYFNWQIHTPYLNLELHKYSDDISHNKLEKLYNFILSNNNEEIKKNKSPQFKLDNKDDFIKQYSIEENFAILYDSLWTCSYYLLNYETFYSSFADNLPNKLRLKFKDYNGSLIHVIEISKNEMRVNHWKYGTFYSYYSKEIGSLSKENYKKITDWDMEWISD